MPPPDTVLSGLEQTLAAVFPGHTVALAFSSVGDLASVTAPEHPPENTTALSAGEQARLASFSLPKRRAQWHAGRICAKQAIAGYLQRHFPGLPCPDLRELVIANLPTGRPFIDSTIPALSGLDLSISHSGGFAAALVSATACGIDIQEDTPTLDRVSDRFCREDERDLLRHLPGTIGMERLNMVWTAKEAARKAATNDRMPGFLELALAQPTSPATGCILWTARHDTDNRRHAGPETTILTTRIDGYALSIALVTGESIHA
jgi:4'-phosphopantetheinyl transferase EntD